MSSITLTLSGESSNLNTQYFPPIELDKQVDYECGLIDFQAYNSIPNISEINNRLYYGAVGIFTLEPGLYRQQDIKRIAIKQNPNHSMEFFKKFENRLNSLLIKESDDSDDQQYKIANKTTCSFFGFDCITIPIGSYEFADIVKTLQDKLSEFKVTLDLTMDTNSLKSTIKCDRALDFTNKNSISSVLGFKKKVLKADVVHTSDNVIKITSINAIRVECSIASGAYLNDTPTHTIHEFYPSVEPGYKIVEVPRNIIYFPVFIRQISQLNVRIVDQENNLINFRGETITLRIHIQKRR